MNQITIKKLLSKDVECFLDLLETLEFLIPVEPLTLEKCQTILTQIDNNGGSVFCALNNKKIIGTATVFILPRFSRGGSLSAYIEDVVVHKNYQKQGIGKLLINHIMKYLKEIGAYKVNLYCSESFVSFYQKFKLYPRDVCMEYKF